MKTIIMFLLAALPAVAGLACGGMDSSQSNATTTEQPVSQTDTNSGDDVALAGARGLFDIAVNDNVDAVGGDNTDYKYFDITERATVSVRVRFMSPDVAGAVALHNDFGETLYEEPVAAGQNEVYIQNFQVLPGRYYVRVYASEGRSDYAIGREFTSSVAVATPETTESPVEETVAPTEEETEAERQAREERRRRRREREAQEAAQNATEPTTETPTGEEPVQVEQPTAEVAVAETIRATILTIRERSGGQGSTLILLGCGSASGLSEGSSGRISGTDARATISRITGPDSCEADSSANVSQIGSASSVSFSP